MMWEHWVRTGEETKPPAYRYLFLTTPTEVLALLQEENIPAYGQELRVLSPTHPYLEDANW